ncbi:hypothetical protein BSL78_12230 [Apostichopus japonicus]|uniref:NACHT domain-containing protein n=1 Tax=Stichopus japonicus TaxID=307972 RepID=A0A2G8KSA3_STIJA|nr:hypothetical protein BSL78_12230 [Apostichopus japonicus]
MLRRLSTPKQASMDRKQASKNFGRFQVGLANLLTIEIILKLSALFNLPPAKEDQIKNARSEQSTPSLLMVATMKEMGIINPLDISPLTKALENLKLHGTLRDVQTLFQNYNENTEDSTDSKFHGKKDTFLSSLRKMYVSQYDKIQPIPYIRDSVSVNDVFVEGGIEIQKNTQRLSRKAKTESKDDDKPDVKPLKSHLDIFNEKEIDSKRILVQGDPGFGKSTFLMQTAYDWCFSDDSSPLRRIDAFVLLTLRLLGGKLSVYSAIQNLLIPGESMLTEEEIKEILVSLGSVVIAFDGYDEYPERDSELQTDIKDIIGGKMFSDFTVIICTRSACIPRNLDPNATRIRLTGFDNNAREEYIAKAVAGGDRKAVERIMQRLNGSPILSDICQVPMFCVMFAHIADETEDLTVFSTVTGFFHFMIHCFYGHMRGKSSESAEFDQDIQSLPVFDKLNKLAFEGLTASRQQLSWEQNDFQKAVGLKCFSELTKIGILVQEVAQEINYSPGTSFTKQVINTKSVRFFHKLFAEWYAANYVAAHAGSVMTFRVDSLLKKISPVDLQFIFRFACGLNKKASKRIIAYLNGIEDGKSFASLCLFEQVKDIGDVTAVVEDLISEGVTIRSSDTRLLQRSNKHLIDIASVNQVRVSSKNIILD